MRWSKVKKLIEDNFCDWLRKRISIHSTAYGNCSCGHAWVTFDKEIVANFCTRAFWNTIPEFSKEKQKWIKVNPIHEKKYDFMLNDYGDLSRQDVYRSCWDYLHSYTNTQALESDDIFMQFLAIVDKKTWKRTLENIRPETLEPFVKFFFLERLNAEKISLTK